MIGVIVRFLIQALFLVALVLPRPAAAEAVKGTVSVVVENGFARLVFVLGDDVESQVRVANNIIVISFDRPVDVNVDKLGASADGYIGAARHDPDGKAVRIALGRKVTVNSMAAGERLFVDLLPDTWTGLPPGLPREVIEELARRAHDAEKKVRQERASDRDRKAATIRVRIATQPTFTRYIFGLPEPIGVAAENGKDKLTLTFSAALIFDLADARADLPRLVQSIDSESDRDSAVVRFTFGGKVDVRTFREDNSYVVDISSAEPKNARRHDVKAPDELADLAAKLMVKKTPPPEDVETPQTVPVQAVPDAVESKRAPVPAAAPKPEKPEKVEKPERAVPAAAAVPAPVPLPPTPVVAAPADDSAPSPAAAPPAAAASAGQAASSLPEQQAVANSPTDHPPPEAEGGTTPVDSSSTVKVLIKVQGDNLTLRFPFATSTPAAVFCRADTLWLVFDTDADIKLAAEPDDPSHNIGNVAVRRRGGASVVRIKLDRPRLTSAATEGATWIVNVGSQIVAPTHPLAVVRNGNPPSRPSAMIRMSDIGEIHQLADPEAGDTLLVVTALAPARGFVGAQDFVEFHVLPSAHGVVIQPLADDLRAFSV